ncbi:MAG: FHA domain-containing protein [Solirubrobacteraceae bacterium]
MVLEPVSVGLKFGFLVVLYLFLLWVARSALKDLRQGPGQVATTHEPLEAGTSMYAAVGDSAESLNGSEPRLVVERAAGYERGVAYDIPDHGATFGRGDVEIRLDDPFASTRHARIFRQGSAVVLEDLGSTNGTYLNEEPLRGPQPLHPGDRIRIGDCEFSYQR